MRVPILLSALIGGSIAQHVHFEPPEVQQYVASMLHQFEPWTHGPSPTGYHPRPTNPIPPKPTASCSYWLENIKHQGIAAFNPSPSTYQVFRNVKDFGAKGQHYIRFSDGYIDTDRPT